MTPQYCGFTHLPVGALWIMGTIAAGPPLPHLGGMRTLDVDQVEPAQGSALTQHLVEGEGVDAAFVSATGLILFTQWRILIVQREHLLDERIETASYPYRELRHFSITEVKGAESRSFVRIWLGAEPQPLHLRASAGTDLGALQRLLAARLR